MKEIDVIVVGGGLAGLTAATILGRAGKRVVLFEKSREPGGRAKTTVENGFRMNLGPHALYRGGEGFRILTKMGIQFSGKAPSAAYSYTLQEKKLQRLPYALFNAELLSFYRRLNRINTDLLQNTSLSAWLTNETRNEKARGILTMLIRVATYSNDESRLSAGAAIEQLRLAISKGVLYIDSGWQVFVEGLTSAAKKAGAEIVPNTRVISIETTNSVRGVRLLNGQFVEGKSIILAVDPEQAMRVLGKVFSPWNALVPVKMAALTVGLKRLPVKNRRAVFDLRQPLYLSVHSEWAKLTDLSGGALVHLGKYLQPGIESDPQKDQTELEQMMDICQPGWRKEILALNFLPSITVTNALVAADMGGNAGRPSIDVPGVPGLYICGDWVGDRGMLSDASFASAERVASTILASMDFARSVA